MKKKVEEVLKKIRPYLQADGGDIELVEVTEDGAVKVRLLMACAGCPMASITFQSVVEKTLRDEVPEIKSVELV